MSLAATLSFHSTFLVSPRQREISTHDFAFDSSNLITDSSASDCMVSTIEVCALSIACSMVDRALTGEKKTPGMISRNILCSLSFSKRRMR